MQPLHPITQALIDGAQAASTRNDAASQALYQQLKTLLLQRAATLQAVLAVLESDPNDEDSQQFVDKQLRKAIGDGDNELQAVATALQTALAAPSDLTVAVELDNLEIGKDLLAADITSTGDGVHLRNSQIKGDAKFSGIQAGALQVDQPGVSAQLIGNTFRDLILDPSMAALEAAELAYLQWLYNDCNELLLANQGPVDANRQRRPRMQHVYVDLCTQGLPRAHQIERRLVAVGLKTKPIEQWLVHLFSEAKIGSVKTMQIRGNELVLVDSDVAPSDLSQQVKDSPLLYLEELQSLTDDSITKFEEKNGYQKNSLLNILFSPLTLLEILRENRQLVLLGDPGGGKSTLTRRLAGVLASNGRSDLDAEEQDWLAELTDLFGGWLLPIRITLSRWASHLPVDSEGKVRVEGSADDLIDECVRLIGQTADLPSLKQRLVKRLGEERPGVLLLLDGLDEVADEARRDLLLKSVRHFCQNYGNTPLIITCRIRPWKAWEEAWKAEGKQQPLPPDFTINKLNDEAIQRFVERWHNELLFAGIYQPADAQLAQNRLLEAIRDPTRTDLSDMAGTPLLLTMMARVNYERGLPDSRAELYEWYMRQLLWEWERTKLDEKGQPTSLEILLRQGNVDSTSLERKLSQLAYDVHASQGDRDTVDIPRNTLREALESIHPGKDEAAKAAWAVKMLALLDDRTGLLRSLDHKLYQFSHRTFQEYLAARWLATGNYLKKFKEKIDLEQWGEAIALALGYLAQVQGKYEDALTILFNLFPKSATTPADWRRVLLLGQAYVRLLGPQKASESEQEEIASTLLARIPQLLTDAMQNRELPAQQRLDAGLLLTRGVNDPDGVGLDIDPPGMDDFVTAPSWDFAIGRYPVTNKQFKRFVAAGGYNQKEWWSEKGWQERQEGKWTQPRLWGDPKWDRNSQPVIGVSWYEAEAYCNWLTAERGEADKLVRLPTEAEWMQAAHAEEGDYPWGNEFDAALANTSESGLSVNTSVHMYKDGTTIEKVYDLSGNVWEWSNDWDEGNYPWLKGGLDIDDAKSSARYWVSPHYWISDFGFRCVVVPSSR